MMQSWYDEISSPSQGSDFRVGVEWIRIPGLVMTNSLLLKIDKWPIEIVDLPNLKMVIFQFANC